VRLVVSWARNLAEARMAENPHAHVLHVRAVAEKARTLAPFLGAHAGVLTAAAWLHDIGHTPSLLRTGCHALDGARYLRTAGVDQRVCALVANHSAAGVEAAMLGADAEMAEFPDEYSLVRDALWCLDMTTGPQGESLPLVSRLEELHERLGADHLAPMAAEMAAPQIEAAIRRVHHRIGQAPWDR
jgi:putative nucleotidyltransferase with HDIG domain